jgi:hypothetical protein
MVVDTLQNLAARKHHDPVNRILKRAAQRTSNCTAPLPEQKLGPLSAGGNGRGAADAVTFIGYLRKGPTPLTYGGTVDTARLRKLLYEAPQGISKISKSSVLITAKAEAEHLHRINEGIPSAKPLSSSYRTVEHTIVKRRTESKKLLQSAGGPLRALTALIIRQDTYMPLTRRLVRLVTHKLRHRNFAGAIDVVQRGWDTTISQETAADVFEAFLPSSEPQYNLRNWEPTARRWDSSASS